MPVILSTLTPPTVKAQNPLIATRADMRDGTRGGGYVPPSDKLLLYINCDLIDDWDSQRTNPWVNGEPVRIQTTAKGHIMPGDHFTQIYQTGIFGPYGGYPDGMSTMSIATADIAEYDAGGHKAFRCVRESTYPDTGWNSDEVMKVYLPHLGIPEQDELYVEFLIRFGGNWTEDPGLGATIGGGSLGNSKLFRMGSYNGLTPEFRFSNEGDAESTHGPLMFWDWQRNSGGVRNFLTFRGGPYGTSYSMDDERMPNKPRSFVSGSRGDMSCTYTNDIVGMRPGGGTAQLPNLVDGGYLNYTNNPIATHAQLFGTSWQKMGFYMRKQSAANVADAVVAQWMNGQRIFYSDEINFCPTGLNGTAEVPKVNCFMLGGNDNFHVYPTTTRRQEPWYFREIRCYGGIPDHVEWD